ncbi:MAG: hypothetical protein ACLQLG_12165 [Thermoguttaceae bacterium]
MNRSLVLAVVALGVWGLALGAEAYAWMPFYGDRTPNYMAQPCVYPTYQYVVPVQGTGPQVVTSYYPPAQGAVIVPQSAVRYISPPQYGCGRFYPFYGYRRPAYLDQ